MVSAVELRSTIDPYLKQLPEAAWVLPPHDVISEYTRSIYEGPIPMFLLRSASGYSPVPSLEKYQGRYQWLKDLKPEFTFREARKHLGDIFGSRLKEDGEEECLRVLSRAAQIGYALRDALRNTSLLDTEHPINSRDLDILQKTLSDLYPLAFSNEDIKSESWTYPVWDQKNNTQFPQERQFYRSVAPHVAITRMYIRELGEAWNGKQLKKGNTDKPHLLDTNLLEASALIHDLGRWVTHHPKIHDEIIELILHYVDLRHDIHEVEFDYQKRYLSSNTEDVDPTKIPVEQVLFWISDFFGKADSAENPAHIRELVNVFDLIIYRINVYQDLNVKTIEEAIQAMTGQQKAYYTSEVNMLNRVFDFMHQLGIPLNLIRARVQRKLEKSLDDGTLFSQPISRLDKPLPAVRAGSKVEKIRAKFDPEKRSNASPPTRDYENPDLSNTHAARAAEASKREVARLTAAGSPLISSKRITV